MVSAVPLPLTRLAANAVADLGRREPDARGSAKAGLCMQDFVGCCIAALRGPLRDPVLKFSSQRAGTAEAAHWGIAGRMCAESAAMGNAMLGHSLIREDMHLAGGSHPGVVIIPAMLALAQRHGWSGRRLVCGIVAGYQLMGALGAASRTGQRNQHFRPLGIYGAFGVAGGAAAALCLDEATTANALGFAANGASGLNQWPWDGGQEVFLHPGLAARNGMVAVDLACAGLQASGAILEGKDGLFAAYGFGPDAGEVFRNRLTATDILLEVTHKPHAGCNFIQTPIAAALAVRQSLDPGAWQDIQQVTIFTFGAARRYPGCDNSGPFTSTLQTKMSLQYGVASALLYGAPDEETYARWDDPRISAIIGRTRLVLDTAFEREFPRAQPARVEVRMKGGEVFAGTLQNVPWLSDAAVRRRFADEAMRYVSGAQVEALQETLDDPRRLEDASELFQSLHRAVAESVPR